jgi:hypothetical protein
MSIAGIKIEGGIIIGGGFFYGSSIASKLVYMNGTTDYLEGYAIVSSNVNTYNNAVGTYFQAYMVRGV